MRGSQHDDGRVVCRDCNGTGQVEVQLNGWRDDDPEADYGWDRCEACDGRGWLAAEAA